jgi:hypothetical protein
MFELFIFENVFIMDRIYPEFKCKRIFEQEDKNEFLEFEFHNNTVELFIHIPILCKKNLI